MQFSIGIMGLFVCLGYAFRLLSHLDERRCIAFTLTMMLLFYLFSYPWPFLSNKMPLPKFANETLGKNFYKSINEKIIV